MLSESTSPNRESTKTTYGEDLLPSKPKSRPPTPEQRAAVRAQDDRADRARRSYPKLDAAGTYRDKCSELAQECGVEFADVWEEWTERAAVREWCGALNRSEAERLAFDDVCTRFRGSA